jgi:hypothetical protein
VRGILFDGKPAVGVEFERGGPGAHIIEHTEADREVILSAGPSAHRTSCSSRVSAPPSIRAASASLCTTTCLGRTEQQKHAIARVSYAVQGVVAINERARAACPLAAEVLRYPSPAEAC